MASECAKIFTLEKIRVTKTPHIFRAISLKNDVHIENQHRNGKIDRVYKSLY